MTITPTFSCIMSGVLQRCEIGFQKSDFIKQEGFEQYSLRRSFNVSELHPCCTEKQRSTGVCNVGSYCVFQFPLPRTKEGEIHLEIALYDLLIQIHNTFLLILIMLDQGLEISRLYFFVR